MTTRRILTPLLIVAAIIGFTFWMTSEAVAAPAGIIPAILAELTYEQGAAKVTMWFQIATVALTSAIGLLIFVATQAPKVIDAVLPVILRFRKLRQEVAALDTKVEAHKAETDQKIADSLPSPPAPSDPPKS